MITIPLKPVVESRLFGGRRFTTKEYANFTTEFLYLIPKDTPKVMGNVKLTINFYIKHSTTTDIDNMLKGTSDCIVKAELIEDDRFIYELNVKKFKTKKVEKIEFEITPIEI